MTQRESEQLVAQIITLFKYAQGAQFNAAVGGGPRRTHNTYATRAELRSLLCDAGFDRRDWECVGIAARILRKISKTTR